MELFEHFIKIIKQRREDVKELMAVELLTVWKISVYVRSSKNLQSLLQEISTLLNKRSKMTVKEQLSASKRKIITQIKILLVLNSQ